MQIDVTERINEAKRLTREWAEQAGYKAPIPEPEHKISDKARNVRRVLAVSDFGCQARNVHALCEALLGEGIPGAPKRPFAEYLQSVPFAIGSVLVPTQPGDDRPGLVTRTSHNGNAGLRLSNSELHQKHWKQRDLRPATDEEIEAYFAEFFGVAINPADVPEVADEPVDELTPF